VSDPGPIKEIHVDELAPLRDSGIVLVDVRMPDEYEEAHVPGAVLIPLPELAERAGEIPDADTIYVVCRSGARSMKACEFLVGGGRDAVNVAGGTMAWIDAGHPVATGSAQG
jgi:rhodanese-related sulfurtransferase